MDNIVAQTSAAFVADGVLKRHVSGFTLGPVGLELPRGYVMGLVGPNGAGKTTCIKCLLGLLHLDGGSIRVLGRQLDSRLGGTSRVGTVNDLPPYPDDWRVSDVGNAYALVDSSWNPRTFSRLARNFDLDGRRRVKELSRGMKVKLQIAAALSRTTELLVMDEPTSGLDPASRAEVVDLIQQYVLDESRSVLFSTHITADLERVGDYVAILLHGQVHDSGTIEDVRARYTHVQGSTPPPGTKLYGLREHAGGFEAIMESSPSLRYSDLHTEPASLDEIVAALGRSGRN
ncbi:MAG TPA: ABC transporter ATP-binding protein [Coriobacteriia bacterium]|nr:ABC transporter ATP-binding protein [Coriobacteriia bacterium]